MNALVRRYKVVITNPLGQTNTSSVYAYDANDAAQQVMMNYSQEEKASSKVRVEPSPLPGSGSVPP